MSVAVGDGIVPVVRGSRDPGDGLDPYRVSASRIGALAQCGVAFKLKYVEKMPEEASGSAALFGSVVHKALEDWAPNRDQDLTALMRQAWLSVTEGTTVRSAIGEYQALSVRAIQQEHAIREAWRKRGKESKAPRRTKEWKDSEIGRETAACFARWAEKLETGSPWRFNEYDPLFNLYDESLVLSKRYAARWGHLPNALYTEFGFEIPWRGFTLVGYIDTIELLVEREVGAPLAFGVGDYKTYGRAPAKQKDWRQKVMYDVALRYLVDNGAIKMPPLWGELPLYVFTDYVRWSPDWVDHDGDAVEPRAFMEVTDADYDRLESELKQYAAAVEGEIYPTADKSRNPDYCPFPSMCCLRNCEGAGGAARKVTVNI